MDRSPNDAMKLVTGDVSQAGVEAVAAGNGKNRGRNHHDHQRLGRRIEHLHHTLSALADEKGFEALIGLIHQPGHTTVAEFKLVEGLVESMHEQAHMMVGLKQLLTDASYTIVGN